MPHLASICTHRIIAISSYSGTQVLSWVSFFSTILSLKIYHRQNVSSGQQGFRSVHDDTIVSTFIKVPSQRYHVERSTITLIGKKRSSKVWSWSYQIQFTLILFLLNQRNVDEPYCNLSTVTIDIALAPSELTFHLLRCVFKKK